MIQYLRCRQNGRRLIQPQKWGASNERKFSCLAARSHCDNGVLPDKINTTTVWKIPAFQTVDYQLNYRGTRPYVVTPETLFDILPTNKFGGFRYQQPLLLMKAKSYKVYFAGRCPALVSFLKLFFYLRTARVPILPLTLPLYLGVVVDLRRYGDFLATTHLLWWLSGLSSWYLYPPSKFSPSPLFYHFFLLYKFFF